MRLPDELERLLTLYTDNAKGYSGVPCKREAVKHSVGKYVRGQASTNGIESFWSPFERGFHGAYHKMSPKQLDRYVREFAGRHNMRESGTLDQMRHTVARLMGRNLLCGDLVADNGLSSGARARFSGVAPARSRLGSSMGFMTFSGGMQKNGQRLQVSETSREFHESQYEFHESRTLTA